MGSAVVRPGVRGLVLLAASCAAACLVLASEARAAMFVPAGCPGSIFPYAQQFRFPPAPEGSYPDCTISIGALTIEADHGWPDVRVGLGGLGVAVDDRGRLAHFGLPGGAVRFDVARRGRPIASAGDVTQHFAFAYDSAGRLSRVSSSSSVTKLSYSSAGELTKLDFGSGNTESFSYDSSGQLAGYSDSPGGDTGTFSYAGGHLSGATITLTATDPSFSFTYSSAGAVSSWSVTDFSTATFNLAVDSAGRVTTVSRNGSTDAALSYGPVAPHLLSTVTGSGGTLASFSYDSKNRLSSASNASTNTASFLYNSLGRLSSATYPSGPSSTATSSLAYDSLGRLVKFGVSGGEQISLVYWPAPAATTRAATNIGRRIATLNGAVNPRGLPARYRFQFGRTQSYGHSTQTRSAGNGKLPVAVAASLRNLRPRTTYHYRLIATTAAGTAIGADRSLHTK